MSYQEVYNGLNKKAAEPAKPVPPSKPVPAQRQINKPLFERLKKINPDMFKPLPPIMGPGQFYLQKRLQEMEKQKQPIESDFSSQLQIYQQPAQKGQPLPKMASLKKLASIIGMRKKAAPNWMAAAKGTLTSGSSPLVSALGAMPGAYNSDPVPRGAGNAYLKMIANQNKQLSRGEAARAYTKDLAGRAADIQYHPGIGLARRIYGKATGGLTAGSAKGPGIPDLNKILGNSSAWLGSAVNQNKPKLESYPK